MTFGEKMTAICNKIRSLLGLSSSMGLDAMASNLGMVVEAVSNTYSAIGSKGGTIPEAKTATNLPAAVDSIVLGNDGVIVQKKSGTLTTDFQGAAAVECGFKPDAVFLFSASANFPGVPHSCVVFTDKSVTSGGTFLVGSNTNYVFTYCILTQNESGFVADCTQYDTSYQASKDGNRTAEYIAIKYT